MLVEVIQLRAKGVKLTAEEIRVAPRHRGNLAFYNGGAYLHRGSDPGREHILTPLNSAIVKRIFRGYVLIYGNQPIDYLRSIKGNPQAWACYPIDGPPEPSAGAQLGRW